MLSSIADDFFQDVARRALAGVRAAPRLTEVLPLTGRGWRLRFAMPDVPADLLEYNVLSPGGAAPGPAVEYRQPSHRSARRQRQLEAVARALHSRLRDATSRVLTDRPFPVPLTPVNQPGPPAVRRRVLDIKLDGGCDRACDFCAVRLDPYGQLRLPVYQELKPGAELSRVRALLTDNAERASQTRVQFSGADCLASPNFQPLVRFAHQLGYREMGIQSPGSQLVMPKTLEFLRAHDVNIVNLTAHAHDEATFDEVGGKKGAYRLFWRAYELLTESRFTVNISVPCIARTVGGLPQHLQHLTRTPSNVSCFYWYPERALFHLTGRIGMPYGRLVDALERARSLVPERRVGVDGVPECFATPELLAHYCWSYGSGPPHVVDFQHVAECDGCPQRADCPGPSAVYLEHFDRPPAR